MEKKLLKDYTDMEKGAYLGAISSIATADHSASDEEIEYIMALADSADLSPEQKQAVQRAATELTGQELKKCLDILKGSDLKYSLVTDLISFAESDKKYSGEEKANVERISQYLGINEQQFNLLDQFVKKTAATHPEPEEINKPSFLSKLGLEQKFQNSGINIGSLTKGLLGIAAPMILANFMRVRQGRGMGSSLNPFSMGGGRGGGLGSIISMLSGGRGFSRTGNMFNRVFGG
ncbi:MAG TPA: TerB family tellurite resistance protein [Chitinophagaceae bacterium]|nr:TerB family tellurite resistance protein [Chitinophagaceae bacterium]